MHIASYIDNPTIFIQIGAGAGDKDSRAGFRDGFTELVKSLPRNRIRKIVLAEPNPANLTKLKDCWSDYEETEIYPIGIAPTSHSGELIFYYADEDSPHYQVCSLSREHVAKHYPNGTIRTFSAPCFEIKNFLLATLNNQENAFVAIDAEGFDYEMVINIDYQYFPTIKNISFESLHLTKAQIEHIFDHLQNCGFACLGKGVDPNGYDLLFGKEPSSTK